MLAGWPSELIGWAQSITIGCWLRKHSSCGTHQEAEGYICFNLGPSPGMQYRRMLMTHHWAMQSILLGTDS